MIDHRKKCSSVIRYWLQQDAFTVAELSEMADMEEQYVGKIIRKYMLEGMVEHNETRLNRSTGKYSRAYKWVGPETIEGMISRAATALRDGSGKEDAIKLSRDLFVFLESTSREYL